MSQKGGCEDTDRRERYVAPALIRSATDAKPNKIISAVHAPEGTRILT